jgi:hypothetical protein
VRTEVSIFECPLIEISRSEVVGRPLAALLANDGARVFSVDIDSIQVSIVTNRLMVYSKEYQILGIHKTTRRHRLESGYITSVSPLSRCSSMHPVTGRMSRAVGCCYFGRPKSRIQSQNRMAQRWMRMCKRCS